MFRFVFEKHYSDRIVQGGERYLGQTYSSGHNHCLVHWLRGSMKVLNEETRQKPKGYLCCMYTIEQTPT